MWAEDYPARIRSVTAGGAQRLRCRNASTFRGNARLCSVNAALRPPRLTGYHPDHCPIDAFDSNCDFKDCACRAHISAHCKGARQTGPVGGASAHARDYDRR